MFLNVISQLGEYLKIILNELKKKNFWRKLENFENKNLEEILTELFKQLLEQLLKELLKESLQELLKMNPAGVHGRKNSCRISWTIKKKTFEKVCEAN